jgi:hypothetical protein
MGNNSQSEKATELNSTGICSNRIDIKNSGQEKEKVSGKSKRKK